MRLLHLYWPHLLLRLARVRSSAPFEMGPIVLGGRPWADGPVLDASRSALELGVRPGMPLGAAHRLAPEARFLDPDPTADRAALEAALDRLADFSPGVAAEADPTAPGFGRAEVQLDGLERLWGPEPLIAVRIGEALAEFLPGLPLAGIGGTRFVAAVAASLAGKAPAAGGTAPGEGGGVRLHIVEAGTDAEFLAPLPVAMLSRDPEVRARLDRFGLRRIGQVAELPLSAVVARFGAEGKRLHARARGLETDPFRPRRAPERMALALPIEPPVIDIEALRFVIHRLVERLLLARIEAEPPPAPVARLELELADVAPAAGCQLTFFTPQTGRTGRLGWQLARLGLRFGEHRVGWMEIADPEAPLAETRWKWRRPVETRGPRR